MRTTTTPGQSSRLPERRDDQQPSLCDRQDDRSLLEAPARVNKKIAEFETKQVQDILNDLEKSSEAILAVAGVSKGLRGDLASRLCEAASSLSAGATTLAARTEKGYFDPMAGRAPSPANANTEELLAANRRMKEENDNLRRQIEERNRTSPPPSPCTTRFRSRVVREENPEEENPKGEPMETQPVVLPPVITREDLEDHPANRPSLLGNIKRLEDPPLPIITSNILLRGDESTAAIVQAAMGQIKEEMRRERREMRKEIKHMRELIEGKLPSSSSSSSHSSLPNPPLSKPPGSMGPPSQRQQQISPPERWSTGRKKKKKETPFLPTTTTTKGAKEASKTTPKSSSPLPKPGTGGERGKKKKKRKVPNTAAISVTCPEGQYSEVMRRITKEISIKEMGIPPLEYKPGQTGACILQIKGPNKQECADKLAQRMRSLLADNPEVRINRPQIMSEIRIRGLAPSTTAEGVAKAVAEMGECSLTEIKVEDIKTSQIPRGPITAWVKCPLKAANKIAQGGHIIMDGFFKAQVELLEARPFQCFKCLERGHVRAKCPSTDVDRSDLCYRCGVRGHEARSCTAPANCAVCRDAGLPASHRMGGPLCKPPKGDKKKREGEAKKASTPPPSKEGKKVAAAVPPIMGETNPPTEEMEVDPTPAATEEKGRIGLEDGQVLQNR
ncbi:uncharacterized protein [Linepithema humile]|uniref:uncharacterized protein n=1 Tax=Linepithema humile TaxID=83485 RepID=UPI00351DE18C